MISIAPGFLISVQEPDGNPLRDTLPVGVEHVGSVIVPIVGAAGRSHETWTR